MIGVTIILTLIAVALCYIGYKVYKLNKRIDFYDTKDLDMIDMTDNFNLRTDGLVMGWEKRFDEMRTNQIGLKEDVKRELIKTKSRITVLEGLLKESKIWKNY